MAQWINTQNYVLKVEGSVLCAFACVPWHICVPCIALPQCEPWLSAASPRPSLQPMEKQAQVDGSQIP